MQEVQAGFLEEVGFGEGFKDEWNWPQSACSHMWIYCQSALFPKGSNCAFVSAISVIEEYRCPGLGAYKQTKEGSISLNKEKE